MARSGKTVQMQTSIPASLKPILQATAKADGNRSLSNFVSMILVDYMEAVKNDRKTIL